MPFDISSGLAMQPFDKSEVAQPFQKFLPPPKQHNFCLMCVSVSPFPVGPYLSTPTSPGIVFLYRRKSSV